MLIMTTTLTATSMSTAEQRLRLMQLASSNLPVGGYSWSQGLEWAVEAGWVPDVAAFERWQRRQMTEGFFTVDLPLFARLYRACDQGDIAAARRWTAPATGRPSRWLSPCRPRTAAGNGCAWATPVRPVPGSWSAARPGSAHLPYTGIEAVWPAVTAVLPVALEGNAQIR